MKAKDIERKLGTIEGLRNIRVMPISAVATPFFVVRGDVFLLGEPYALSTEIKITEFNSDNDVARLGASLLAAVAGASRKVTQ